jgi:DNA-binding transcriptional regulator YhcF (GntR family)
MKTLTHINAESKVPKYKQLVNSIISHIEKGILKSGDRLPSINETSEEYYLSRDTVERAYCELYKQGIITSIYRKGYFIAGVSGKPATRIFMLVGKITEHTRQLYQSVVQATGKHTIIDIYTYNYKTQLFKDVINNHLGNYHYYLIMPHMIECDAEVNKVLRKIPGDRLLFMDKVPDGYTGAGSGISIYNEEVIYTALQQATPLLEKYKSFNLVLSNEEFCHLELISAFKRLCEDIKMPYQIIDGLDEEPITSGNAYFTLDDADLVEVVRYAGNSGKHLGQDIGVLSFGDACFKEVLANGISVIATEVEQVGKSIMSVMDGQRGEHNIAMRLLARKSL